MEKKTKRKILFIVFFWVLIFILTILFDAVLGLVGYPSEWRPTGTYPPNSKHTRRSTNEFECEYEFNSQGIRYPEIPLAKEDADEIRFFLVGDSFTEGMGVEAKETFSSILEQLSGRGEHPVRFINGGIRGTGPWDYLRVLNEVGFQYEVDGVVICLFSNDLIGCPKGEGFDVEAAYNPAPGGVSSILYRLYPRLFAMGMKIKFYTSNNRIQQGNSRDIVAEVSWEARRRGISEEKIAAWKDRLPENLLEASNRFEFNAGLLSAGLLSPEKYRECFDLTTKTSRTQLKNMKAILNKMVKECRDRSIRVYTLFIPVAYMYDPSRFDDNDIRVKMGLIVSRDWLTGTTALQREISEWATEQDIPFFDLTETFRNAVSEQKGALNYVFDSHWTLLGHQVAGEAIQKWLLEIDAISETN